MIDSLKQIYKGTLGTSLTTLYTVPAAKKLLVREIIISNKTATSANVTIQFDNINIFSSAPIDGNDSLIVELHSVLPTAGIIKANASTASAIDIYISGMEM